MSTQLLIEFIPERTKLCISAPKRYEYKIAASYQNDDLRLFHLFRTGSAPGGSLCFPMHPFPDPHAFSIL